VLLDTHVLHWWSSDPERLSGAAAEAIESTEELAIASITWFELAWLARNERIILTMPILAWLDLLASQVRTVPATPAIAASAVSLPASFPGDPADRLIYATAIEEGWTLVTKDERLRNHRHPRQVTVW
jgi:PIN domain nuclease of toxin-antitoxin system